jgi:hypothetical protein
MEHYRKSFLEFGKVHRPEFFKHLAYLSKGLKFTLHNHASYFIHNLGQLGH